MNISRLNICLIQIKLVSLTIINDSFNIINYQSTHARQAPEPLETIQRKDSGGSKRVLGSVPAAANILKNSFINQRKYFIFMTPNFIFHLKNRQRAIYTRVYDIFIQANIRKNVIQMIQFFVVAQNPDDKLVYIVSLLFEFHCSQ